MRRSFGCEWTKLWRGRQMMAVWGTMAGMVLFVAAILFGTATSDTAPPPPGQQAALPLALFGTAGGLSLSLQVTAQLLGVVAFVLVAGSMAGEYTQGTLKNLLARDPVRLRVLAGKTLALLLFATVGVLFAGAMDVVASAALAALRHVDTSAWWTRANLQDLLLLLGRVALADWAWGLLGLLLAVLLRNGPAAIGIGLAYTILGESLLALAVRDVAKYMPGQALQAFVRWGAPQPLANQGLVASLSGPQAVAVGILYAIVFAAVAAGVFQSRDVAG